MSTVRRSFDPTEHPRAPAGSTGGGEFTAGSGGGGKSGTRPAAHHGPTAHQHGGGRHHAAAHKPVSPLKTTLSYDPKTKRGAGYGTRDGDPHVHELQRALNRLGLTDAAGKKLVDDGKLGPRTTAALKKAQKALGLKQDGLLTPALYQRLLAVKTLPATHHAHRPHQAHPAHRSASAPFGQISRNVNMADPQDPTMPDGIGMDMPDMQMHQELCALLAQLGPDELAEIAALAEAMLADGGQ